MAALTEEEILEEEDSLDRDLNAQVSEQPSAGANQIKEVTNPGQMEASGDPTKGSTVVEDTPIQASPPAIQDLTAEE
ncbi:hypothetical protein RHSIM_Rhsim09G0065600 [Rhododendron simsii]|uniref:Uncharacterized protein n=1 Tax=Rhododendron simsii TaxID=118357 RepID=A0A834GIQ7_RHOSS|nr:hypothetical protein RHSIM_Rhsim09G0065600 [Rhododendron simsii]